MKPRLILLLAVLALATGCQHFSADNRKAVLAAGSVEQSATTIKAELLAARPHADGIGQAHIDSAQREATSIQSKMPPINTSLAEAEEVKADRDRLKDDWLSFKQRELILRIKVALMIWGAVIIISWAVMTFAAGTPYEAIATPVFHVSTIFVFWIKDWLVGLVKKKT